MNNDLRAHRRSLRATAIALAAVAATALALPAVPAAASTAAPVVATIHLPRGTYQLASGLGAMWALSGDEYVYSTLYRIDPLTNTATEVADLGFPGAALTVGYGSVWVTDYYANRLVRLTPRGQVQATIKVGLQPQFVHIYFGSVWTSNHHAHSLSRIDPLTNGVTATIDVGARLFRNGPEDFTRDQQYLYVESANLPYLQRVDPATNSRTNLTSTGFDYGGDLVWTDGPAGGTLWNQPLIDSTGQILMDGYDILGTVRVAEPVANHRTPNAIAHLGHTVYYGENPDGVSGVALIKGVDQVTGTRVVTLTAPGRISGLHTGFGDLWCVDNNTIRRIDPAAAMGGMPPART